MKLTLNIILIVAAGAVFSAGCANSEFRTVRYFGAAPNSAFAGDRRYAVEAMGEYVGRETLDFGARKPKRYGACDVVAHYRIPPQSKFPRGASILRGVAVQEGVAEVNRNDLAVTVFVIPAAAPACLRNGVPSKGGFSERYFLYDLAARKTILLVVQGDSSAIGGYIRVAAWDTRTNRVDELWSSYGEEDGVDFSHSFGVNAGRPHLTVSGVFLQKRRAYEKTRERLAAALGFPVTFVYDSRYEDR